AANAIANVRDRRNAGRYVHDVQRAAGRSTGAGGVVDDPVDRAAGLAAARGRIAIGRGKAVSNRIQRRLVIGNSVGTDQLQHAVPGVVGAGDAGGAVEIQLVASLEVADLD